MTRALVAATLVGLGIAVLWSRRRGEVWHTASGESTDSPAPSPEGP